MKIYMISLKRDIERREQMQKKFPRYYPKFHIIDAVDAKDESSAEIIQKYDKPCPHDKRRPLTKGEKCCAISHLLALEDFLQSGDERCIIIEDDIFGDGRCFRVAIDIINQFQQNGLIILGGQQGLKNSKYLCGVKTHINDLWYLKEESRQFILRTCCYSVDRSTAKKIIKYQEQGLTRADNWSRLLNKKTKMYYSNLFEHPNDSSMSHLECERKENGVVKKIINDGVLNICKRNFFKITCYLLILTKKADRLLVK